MPDAILVLAAVLPWQFFSSALSESSASLIGNTGLISKVYFPRLIIPLAAVATAFVDFLDHARVAGRADGVVRRCAGRADAGAAAVRRARARLLALGLGLLLAALTVTLPRFPLRRAVHGAARAVRLADRVRVRAGAGALARRLCAQSAGRHHRRLPLVDPRRQAPLDARLLLSSVADTLALLVTGMWYFRRTERGFADAI